jgi:hypothetical protein
MRLEGFLLIAGPLVIYGLLVLLPPERGYRITAVLGSIAVIVFLVSAMTKPSPRYVDVGPFIATFISTLVLAPVVGAFGYHAVARRKGASWLMRLLFLVLAAAFGFGLFEFYRFLS